MWSLGGSAWLYMKAAFCDVIYATNIVPPAFCTTPKYHDCIECKIHKTSDTCTMYIILKSWQINDFERILKFGIYALKDIAGAKKEHISNQKSLT